MKTALVTGAGGGIGSAIALKLAEEGFAIALHYNTSKDQAEAAAKEIMDKGGLAQCFKADLKNEQEVQGLVSAVKSVFGRIDILVNNAGISRYGLLIDMEAGEWDEIMDSNLRSVFLMSKAALPLMINQGAGSIINISSMWGQAGASFESAYSASKGGIIALTKALAKEMGPSGIRVNCVAPGLIETPMTAGLSEETIQELIDETPLGRIGRPEDVAEAAAFLASDKASFITGQVLGVNGGFVI